MLSDEGLRKAAGEIAYAAERMNLAAGYLSETMSRAEQLIADLSRICDGLDPFTRALIALSKDDSEEAGDD